MTASNPVSLMAFYTFERYSVPLTIFPVQSLQRTYRVPSLSLPGYDTSSQILVVALNDGTTVELSGFYIKKTFSLNKYEVFSVTLDLIDLSATYVKSNHPVAVFGAADLRTRSRPMIMQAPAIDSRATRFITPTSGFYGFAVRIYAIYDNTSVSINGDKPVRVYKEIFLEKQFQADPADLIANKPIFVTLYNKFGTYLVQAVSQFLPSYTVYGQDFINLRSYRYDYGFTTMITIETNKAAGLLMNGVPIIYGDYEADSVSNSEYTLLFITVKKVGKTTFSHIENTSFGLGVRRPFYYNDHSDLEIYIPRMKLSLNSNNPFIYAFTFVVLSV